MLIIFLYVCGWIVPTEEDSFPNYRLNKPCYLLHSKTKEWSTWSSSFSHIIRIDHLGQHWNQIMKASDLSNSIEIKEMWRKYSKSLPGQIAYLHYWSKLTVMFWLKQWGGMLNSVVWCHNIPLASNWICLATFPMCVFGLIHCTSHSHLVFTTRKEEITYNLNGSFFAVRQKY